MCGLLVVRSDPVEQSNETVELGWGERRNAGHITAGNWLLELCQKAQAGRRYVAPDPSAVVIARPAADEAFSHQPIDQSRDAGCLLDHSFADRKRRQPLLSGAAQDSEHVVLLERYSVWLDDCREVSPDGIRGAKEADGGLLLACTECRAGRRALLSGGHAASLWMSLNAVKRLTLE